jgi:hypothetical protein
LNRCRLSNVQSGHLLGAAASDGAPSVVGSAGDRFASCLDHDNCQRQQQQQHCCCYRLLYLQVSAEAADPRYWRCHLRLLLAQLASAHLQLQQPQSWLYLPTLLLALQHHQLLLLLTLQLLLQLLG